MPRLPVDIDLTYQPAAARPESLSAINAVMERMAEGFRERLPDVRVDQDSV
jgi:hypothetical protein